MTIIGTRWSIRGKLGAAFMMVACFAAIFVCIAISAHFSTIERAAQLEGEHVAELIADGAMEGNGIKPRLQDYVVRLNAVRKRDVVIVDAGKRGLADIDANDVGTIFDHDSGNEVGKTISDSQVRTFIEKNSQHVHGAYQIVVPLGRGAPGSGKAALGAVILEYSDIREELFAVERDELYLIIATGIATVLLVTIFGLGIARRIAQPLLQLKASVDRIAAQDYEARVAAQSQDEIGLLGTAFNRMAEDLSATHAELVGHKRDLEERVAARTGELARSNALLEEEARQRRLATERADFLAYYDPLTGLANRSLLLDRLAQHIRKAASGGHKLALYLIDLERFKNINDSLGRPAGDALLRQVADWLTHNVGDASLVARVAADEFAVLLPEVRQEGDAARFLEKSIETFMQHPFHLNGAVFRIAGKAGVAVFPDNGIDADTLFKHAEAALKHAKARGERYLLYSQRMTVLVAGQLTLENQLRRALDEGEFVLHYQPKVDLASGKITGAEALIRWQDPQTGLVPPGRFIPVLEETGLIHEVGRWAMRQAVADYLRWRAAGLAAVRVAVNVSPLQLRNRGFLDEIKQVIGTDEGASDGLELEITESLIMEDVQHNIGSLQAIRALGVPIAIDDFGTGFSSLSYLSKLPVDSLKIDRSFVIEMTKGPSGLALVSTIINLAHSLKLKVVAEGVETADQQNLLRLLRCDEMQGYLFSKPVPVDDFESNFLRELSGSAFRKTN
ncbi:MAG: hypothetical protein JWN73_2661 [Betaproteobacteria bacterium]|nr:hypothetical protein [Betaproteobacteria bacterium]